MKAGVEFDFGGIVKGMMADPVVEMLKAGSAQSAWVQIGGENDENPIQINGKEFYDIFDPRTGYPANTGIVSVSIGFPKVRQVSSSGWEELQ